MPPSAGFIFRLVIKFVLKEMVLFRYEKKYETIEEMKLRFQIFSENLDLIRSTNRKGLSYKLGVNGKPFLFFGFVGRIKLC